MGSIPSLLTTSETEKIIVSRIKALRLMAGYKRVTLAKRSGVSESSLKRFESSGQVSLRNLLRLVAALGRIEEFAGLFSPPEATSLLELKAQVT